MTTRSNTLLTGLILTLMGSVAVSVVAEPFTVLAGLAVVLAALVGLFLVSRTQRRIALALILVGLVALAVAVSRGARPGAYELSSVNQNMIAMIGAVSFLPLITDVDRPARPRRAGAIAVWRTAGILHLLGSVLNLAALNIVGDRLANRGALAQAEALLLSRAFAACAFWSPFWAAAAAALAYAPGAQIGVLAICGFMLAIATLAFGISGVVRRFGDDLRDYRGYVPTWHLLRAPLALGVIVIAGHLLWPDVPIPNVVLLGAVGITVIVVTGTAGRDASQRVTRHTVDALPRLRAEVTLFAAAGVLAMGLGQFFGTADVPMPVSEFTVPVAWVVTIAMVVFALVGVHPVISIATIATITAPLAPDPTLFAMASMIAWGTAAIGGPVTGLNIYMNGRFGIDNFAVAARNLPLVVVVLLLAGPVLFLSSVMT